VRIFAQWFFLKNFGRFLWKLQAEIAHIREQHFSSIKAMQKLKKYMGLATFWVIFSQTHLVILA
jgi:hypothetical protein